MCPVLVLSHCYQYFLNWPRYRLLKFCKKKVGFSPKWGWSAPFMEFFFSPLGLSDKGKFFEVGHFFQPPLVFPQIAKMWISRKWKTTKVCFRTFPDLWRHPYTELFCLILNLTYRTYGTFFSRRLSFGSPCQVSDAGWVSKVTKGRL